MSGLNLAVIVNGVSSYGGKEIAKRLSRFFKGHIYLTGADQKMVDAIRFELKLEKYENVKVRHVDTSNDESVENFQKFIWEFYGKINIYINYEGITDYNEKIEAMNQYELAEYCLKKNYFQVKQTNSWMFPLLAPNAQVVHLISNFDNINTYIEKHLINFRNLSEVDLDNLVRNYLRGMNKENSKHINLNTKHNIESFSRIALTLLTKIQQQTFDKQDSNISVNVLITNHVIGTYLDKNYHHILTEQQLAQVPVKMVLRKNNTFQRRGKLISGLKDIIVF